MPTIRPRSILTQPLIIGILIPATALLLLTGGLVGSGTLLSGIDMIIPGAQPIVLFGDGYPGFLIAILPPGAFIALGCLIAGRNWIEARKQARARANPPAPSAPADAPAEPA